MSQRHASDRPPHGNGWRLRAYRDGDEHEIVRQFERVFGRRISPEFWRWKLKTSPSPAENVWLAVDGDDRPIFQYAAMPRRLRLPTGTVDALVLVDLWTAPEYRGRRIFTESANWVHDYWRRSGIAGVLSPFNARGQPRYRRFGWEYLFPLRWQIRPLRPEAIAARRLGVSGLQHWRFLGRAWNGLWDRGPLSPALEIREVDDAQMLALTRAEGGRTGPRNTGSGPPRARFALEHDANWVRWRYLDCPRHRFAVLSARRASEPAGHLAYRIEESEGRRFAFVAEIVGRAQDTQRTLIDAALARCKGRGAIAVATLAAPGTDLYRALRRRGFLFSWGSFWVHWLPLQTEPAPEQLRDPRLWEMTGGDYDVI